MANKDRPDGLRAIGARPKVEQLEVAASQTIVRGDPVYLDSSGQVTIAIENDTAVLCGVAAGVPASATAGAAIQVYTDPDQVYEIQCSGDGTGATMLYATAQTGAAYDLDGSTGIWEMDENASNQNLLKVIGIGRDPVSGQISADGTNQRFYVKISRLIHQMGVVA